MRFATEFAYGLRDLDRESSAQYLPILRRCEALLTAYRQKHAGTDYSALLDLHQLHLQIMQMDIFPQDANNDLLFVSWILLQMYPLNEMRDTLRLQKEVLNRIYPILAQWEAETIDLTNSLSALAQTLPLGILPQRWSKEGRYYRSDCKRLLVDPILGKVFLDDQTLSFQKPANGTDSALYRRLFPISLQVQYVRQGNSVYYFNHPQHGPMRFLGNAKLDIQILRGNDWFQLFDMENLAIALGLPRIFEQENYLSWIAINQQKIVITGNHDWQSVLLTIDHNNLPSHVSGYHCFCPYSPILASMDAPFFYEMQQKTDSTQIEYSRLFSIQKNLLKFHYEKKRNRFCWNEDPRYHIESDELPNPLPVTKGFLILSDPDSRKKIFLVRVSPLDPNCSQAFQSKGEFLGLKILLKDGYHKKYYYLAYDWDPDTQALDSQNLEGSLFLAYLSIHQREYDRASELLDQIFPVDQLSELAGTILNYIVLYPEQHKNCSPIAIALSLKAASYSSVSAARHLYQKYLDRIHHIPPRFHISHECEQRLLRQQPEFDSLPRLAYLSNVDTMPASSSQSARYFMRSFSDPNFDLLLLNSTVQDMFTSFPSRLVDVRTSGLSAVFWSCWKHILQGDLRRMKAFILSHLISDDGQQSMWMRFLLAAVETPNIDKKIQQSDSWPSNLMDIEAIKAWYQRVQPHLTTIGNSGWLVTCQTIDKGDRIEDKSYMSDLAIAPETVGTIETACSFKEPLSHFQSPEPVKSLEFPSSILKTEAPAPLRSAVEEEYKNISLDLCAGQNALCEKNRVNREDVEKILTTLKEKRETLLKSSREREREILVLANKMPLTREEQLHRQIDLETHAWRALTLKDLVAIFLTRSTSCFKRANPALTTEEVHSLFSQLAVWMAYDIHLHDLEEALQIGQTIFEIDQKSQPDCKEDRRQLCCKKLYAILNRNLDSIIRRSDAVNLLVFCHTSKKFPRSDQINHLDHLLRHPFGGSQMNMGGGKSSVLAPLLAWNIAQEGQKLPVLMVDPFQYDKIIAALKKSQRTSFGQEVFVLPKLTKPDLIKIIKILEELKDGLKKKKLLILCPSTLQLFDLWRTQSLFVNGECQVSDQACNTIHVLNNVLTFFRERCAVICDEADLVLRMNKAINIPSGKRKALAPLHIAIVRQIFEALVSDELQVGNKSMRHFVGLETHDQIYLSEADWNVIRPILAEHLARDCRILKLEAQHISPFCTFVTQSDQASNEGWIVHLEKLRKSETITDREAAELICTIKYVLLHILPDAFSQSGGRHFGRANNSSKVIPFSAGMPSNTEIANQYEALVKQFMISLQSPVNRKDVLSVASRLLGDATRAVAEYGELFDNAPEEAMFRRIAGCSLLEIEEPDRLAFACERISASPFNRLYLEQEIALQHIFYHEERLSSNAHCLMNLSNQLLILTGTPWNKDGFIKEITDHLQMETGAGGKIAHTILARKETTQVIPFEREIGTFLNQCFDPNTLSLPDIFTDAEGLFSKYGYSAEDMAQELLKFLTAKGSKQRAVLFFSDSATSATKSQLMALVNKGGADVPTLVALTDLSREEIAKAGLQSPKEYILFLSEGHATGTDAQLDARARGIVTVGRRMTLRDLFQAIMRQRGFLDLQHTDFVVSKKFLESIPSGTSPIDYILQIALINETEQKCRSTLRAYVQMLNAVVKETARRAMEQLVDKDSQKLPNDQQQELISKWARVYRSYFYLKQSDELFSEMAGRQQNISTMDYLLKYAEAIVQQLSTTNGISDENCLQNIRAELQKILQRARENQSKFQHSVSSKDTEATEVEIQQEQQKEQQIEQQTQAWQQVELQMDQANKLGCVSARTPQSVDLFAKNSAEFLQIVNTIDQPMDKIHSWPAWIQKKADAYPAKYAMSHIFKGQFRKSEHLFSSNVCGTNAYFLAYTENEKILPESSDWRMPSQVLMIQKEEKCYFLLLSISEGVRAKEWLLDLYQQDLCQNVWLMHSSGALLVKNPHADLPMGETDLQRGIVELCLFQGHLSSILHLGLVDLAISVTNENPLLQTVFANRYKDNPHQCKMLFMNGIWTKDAHALATHCLNNVTRTEAQAIFTPSADSVPNIKDFRLIKRLPPELIQYLTPSQVSKMDFDLVSHLKKPEQIAAIPLTQLAKLHTDQVQFLTAEQSIHLTDKALITYLPEKTIQEIKKTPKEEWIRCLSSAQIGYIVDPSWIQHLETSNLCYLSERLQNQIPQERLESMPIEVLEKLSDAVIAKTPDRATQLSTKRLEKIQNCHLLSNDWIQKISANQIAKLKANIPLLFRIFQLKPDTLNPKQLVDTYLAQADDTLAQKIESLNKEEFLQLIPPEHYEKLLHRDLVKQIADEESILKLGNKLQFVSLNQLITLLDHKRPLDLNIVNQIDIDPDQIKKLTVNGMLTLIEVRPDCLQHYENPEVIHQLKPIDITKLGKNLLHEIQDAKLFERLEDGQIQHTNANFAHLMSPNQRKQLQQAQITKISDLRAARSLPRQAKKQLPKAVAQRLSKEYNLLVTSIALIVIGLLVVAFACCLRYMPKQQLPDWLGKLTKLQSKAIMYSAWGVGGLMVILGLLLARHRYKKSKESTLKQSL